MVHGSNVVMHLVLKEGSNVPMHFGYVGGCQNYGAFLGPLSTR